MKKILLYLLLTPLVSISYSQVKLDSGLIAYYPFNGNADDVSGNKNNPIHNSATLTADRMGNANQAYHFNGKNSYMQVRNHPSLNTADQMSIAVWVRPTGYYKGKCSANTVLMKGDNDNKPGIYFIRFADLTTGCSTINYNNEMFQAAGGVVTNTPLVNLNQWYSVVWVCNNNTISLYVDSVLCSSVPGSYNSFSNRYDLFIGHHNDATFPYWFTGDLDEIRIYDRSLTKEEVLLLSDKNKNPASK